MVEKSKGRIDSSRVHLLPLEEIRIGGAYRVQEVLYKLKPGHVLVVDVVDQDDLAVFVTGLLQVDYCTHVVQFNPHLIIDVFCSS